MNTKNILTFAIVMAVLIALTGCSDQETGNNGAAAEDFQKPWPSEPSSPAFAPISTGSTGTGDVMIGLTPHEPVDGLFSIDLAANTHSVDLTQFDLMQITILEMAGKKLTPESASALAGHHSYGAITFKIDELTKPFTITIQGIPAVEQRIFTWE